MGRSISANHPAALAHLPSSSAAAHNLVRLLDDELSPSLPIFIFSLGLVIAHVHELRVVVAVCSFDGGEGFECGLMNEGKNSYI